MNTLRLALRMLKRNPLFSAVNIVGLTLGFSVLYGLATYVTGEMSYDDFHENSDRIFRVTMDIQNNQYQMHWARQNRPYVNNMPDYFPQIEHLIRFQDYYARDIEVDGEVHRISNAYTTDHEVFEVFNFKLLSGNPGSALLEPNSVVITEDMAMRFFGRTNVMGEHLIFRDNTGTERITYEVTGVMENLPQNTHMPVNLLTSFPSEDARTGWAYTYVLLNDRNAAIEIEAKTDDFINQYFDDPEEARAMDFPLQNLRDIHLSGGLAREIQPVNNRAQLMLFTGVGLVVFLLTLINFINLNSAQAIRRQSEIGVRKILGAAKTQVSLQFVGEAAVIVVLSLICATILFQAFRGNIQAVLPSSVVWWQVLPFIGAAGIISIVLAAYYPSIILNTRNASSSLRHRDIASNSNVSTRTVLVGFQMVLCIAMVSAALISSRQFEYISEKNLGFEEAQVLALKDLAEPVKERKDYLKEKLRALPGVEDVAAVMEIPSREIRDAGPVYVRSKGWNEEQAPVMDVQVIDDTFTRLMGMDLMAGRNFAPLAEAPEVGEDYLAYIRSAPREYMINETAMRAMGWEQPEQAIGEVMRWEIGDIPLQDGPIIGVIRDYHQESLRNTIEPLVLIQEPIWTRHILVKVTPDRMQDVLASVNDLWQQDFQEHPLETAFLNDLYAQLYEADARQIQLMKFFSVLAISISFLGIFGLLTYVMKSREKELAIRKVLGASMGSITRLVSKRFVIITLAGASLAIPATWYLMNQWLSGFAYHISIDIAYFLLSLAVVIAVFLLVVFWQTRRLSRTNPTEILRSE